jgi:uncharacterized protein (DUF4415 family)
VSVKRIGKRGEAGKIRRRRRVRMTLAEAMRRPGRTDWARVDAFTDAEIAAAVAADPDAAPLLREEWFARAQRLLPGTMPEPKRPVSIRLDESVLAWFKEQGPRYQSRINAVLRAYASAHRENAAK